MGSYGHFRGTGDLDVLVNATDKNAERLIKASFDYGIARESLSKEMFLIPKMIGIGQTPLRIEILKKLDQVDCRYAYQRAEIKNVDGLNIHAMGLEDLILLKKAAKKGRDAENVSFLGKLRIQKFKKKM